MNFKNVLQKPFRFLMFGLFILWLVILLIAYFIPNPKIIYDELNQINVSSQYTLEVPLLRYLIEPFTGLSFIMPYDNFDWCLLFVVFFAVSRIVIFIFEKKYPSITISDHRFFYLFQDALEVFMKIAIIVFMLVFAYLGIGFGIVGFTFAIDHFQFPILLAAWISVLGFIVKLIVNLVKSSRFFSINFLKNLNDKKWILRKELTRPIGTFALIFFFTLTLSTINFPTQHINVELNSDEILCDFHSHTFLSDGDLSPEQRVLWYMRQGIHAAAISDHDQPQGALRAKKFVEDNGLDFTVIVAQEYTSFTPGVHINIFGLDEVILPDNFYGFPYSWDNSVTSMNISDMIAYVHSQGGWVIVNHYYDEAYYTLEELRDFGVDGFEIINDGRVYDIRQFCIDNNLIALGGSDVHSNKELNTFVKLKLDDPNDKSIDAIFTALKNNPSEVIYIDYSNPVSSELLPFIATVWTYLTSLNIYQIISWMAWSTGIFAAINIILKKSRYLMGRGSEKQLQ